MKSGRTGPLRRTFLIFGVVAILGLGALLFRQSLRVKSWNNDRLQSPPYVFHHESLQHPRLRDLREREALDAVVSAGKTQLEKLRRLCHWTRAQWEPGTPEPYPPWDALVVLDWIRSKKTGGFCSQYAQVFAQACLSFGWQPRYVEIGPADNPVAHYTTEVWMDSLAKWVLLDPLNDVWFEREGVPLSGLEIHRALVTGEQETLRVRQGPDGNEIRGEERTRLIDLFYHLRLHVRMDHLTRPDGPFEREDMIDWIDDDSLLWDQSKVESSENVPHLAMAPRGVRDPREFNFDLNRIFVECLPDRFSGTVVLRLHHNMPDFDHFRIRIDDRPWNELRRAETEISPGSGVVRVEVLPVNVRGVEGVKTELELSWWP